MNDLTTLQQIKNCMQTVKGFVAKILEAIIGVLTELEEKVNPAYAHSTSLHAPTDAEKNIIVGVKRNGTDISIDNGRFIDIEVPTKVSELDNDSGFITASTANTTYELNKEGSTIKLIGSDGSESSVSDDDTIYPMVTQDLPGLMSASDKSKLDGIDENANKYTHPEFHLPSVISQDGYNRFVTDEEKNKWNSALQDAKDYTDLSYHQSTGYTDQKIANLINGASSTMDTLGEIEKAMTENHDVVEALHEAVGKKANQAEMDSLLATKLDTTGDSKSNTITFTSGDSTNPTGWTDIAAITSGSTHATLANRFTTAVKNLRYIWKLIGNADISNIGDGTISGALTSLNSNLYLKPGDTIRTSAYSPFAGYTTGGGSSLYFTIPFSKPMSSDVKNAKIECTNLIVRGVNGTIISSSNINEIKTMEIYIYPHMGISVYLGQDAAFDHTSTNTPIVVLGTMTITLF